MEKNIEYCGGGLLKMVKTKEGDKQKVCIDLNLTKLKKFLDSEEGSNFVNSYTDANKDVNDTIRLEMWDSGEENYRISEKTGEPWQTHSLKVDTFVPDPALSKKF